MSQSIVDWFDHNNPEHMAIWKYVSKTGFLPMTGVPENLTFPVNWQINLVAKMAMAWEKLFPDDKKSGETVNIVQKLIEDCEAVMAEAQWAVEDRPEFRKLIEITESTIEMVEEARKQ